MARPDPPGDGPSPDDATDDAAPGRPAWAGATGYHPAEDAAEDPVEDSAQVEDPPAARPGYLQVPEGMAPHAPMPGAPPYPALPPPEITAGRPPGPPSDPTPFPRALAAAAVWLAVNLLLNLVLTGSAGSLAGVATLVGFTLVVGLVLWLVLRRRTLLLWQLVLIAAPVYWIVRLLVFPRHM
jgi:hypothetical protein